ncbi:Hypp4839 [Branchiostoma lanceolatum]|uniref:Hypp4839 protein n=1 Tax=Branchiostoma lanceolatum TaxID=7740 RepID=A0A8K0ABP4_BRALA|nr:Hypp4839 [Branchiostoma lanceolatum]
MIVSKSLVVTLVVTIFMATKEARGFFTDRISSKTKELKEATEDQEIEKLKVQLSSLQRNVNLQSRIMGQMGMKLKEIESKDVPTADEMREMREGITNMGIEVENLEKWRQERVREIREHRQDNAHGPGSDDELEGGEQSMEGEEDDHEEAEDEEDDDEEDDDEEDNDEEDGEDEDEEDDDEEEDVEEYEDEEDDDEENEDEEDEDEEDEDEEDDDEDDDDEDDEDEEDDDEDDDDEDDDDEEDEDEEDEDEENDDEGDDEEEDEDEEDDGEEDEDEEDEDEEEEEEEEEEERPRGQEERGNGQDRWQSVMDWFHGNGRGRQ